MACLLNCFLFFVANKWREDSCASFALCLFFQFKVKCIELLTNTQKQACMRMCLLSNKRSEQNKYAANGCWFNALTIYTFRLINFLQVPVVRHDFFKSHSKLMPTHFTTSDCISLKSQLKVCHLAYSTYALANKIDANEMLFTIPNNSTNWITHSLHKFNTAFFSLNTFRRFQWK